jgi:hypothetical protein
MIEQSANLVGAKYRHDSACGSGRLEIAAPISDQGAFWAIFSTFR